MVYRTRGRFIGRITANQLRFHLDPSNLMTREKAKPTVYIIFQPVDVTGSAPFHHYRGPRLSES